MNTPKFDRFYNDLITIFDLQIERQFLEASRKIAECSREFLDREVELMAASDPESLIGSFTDAGRSGPPPLDDLLIAGHLLKQHGDIQRIYSNPGFTDIYYLALSLILEAVKHYPEGNYKRSSLILDEIQIHSDSDKITREQMDLLEYVHKKADYQD